MKRAGRSLLLVGAGVVLWRRRRARLEGMIDDFAGYWRRRARRPGQLRYVSLGDSLAQGLSARRPELGFVGLLADELTGRTGQTVAVRNLSVSGASVADVLAEQLPELRRMVDGGAAPDLVTVCVGTNDVARMEPERFRAQFRELCAGLPDGALVADIPDFPAGPHRAAAQEHSAICREVIGEFPSLVGVGVERATLGLRVWELGSDLAHPGNPGHRRYAFAFRLAAVARSARSATGTAAPRSGAAWRPGWPGSHRRSGR